MHRNVELLQRFYDGVHRRQASEIAACYAPAATFEDIAFCLEGQPDIAAMWQMICEGDICVHVDSLEAGERSGTARIVAWYTFSDTKRLVRNEIRSDFTFQDGLISAQHDDCDPKKWAAMAFGGVKGFIAGRNESKRRKAAQEKLDRYKKPKGLAV
jgi:hypothetical protein